MIYSVYGYLCGDSSIKCEDCAEKWLKSEKLTEPEIRYLLYGADDTEIFTGKEKMREWPVRNEKGETVYDEKTDEPLMRKEMDYYGNGAIVINKNDIIHRLRLEACSRLYEDGTESQDGEYCDDCSKELAEPYTENCWECDTPLATGEEENSALKPLKNRQYLCKACYEHRIHEAIDYIGDKTDALRLPEKQARFDTLLQRVRNEGIYTVYMSLSRTVSITDSVEQTADALFLSTVEDVIENDENNIIAYYDTENELQPALVAYKLVEEVRQKNGGGEIATPSVQEKQNIQPTLL